MINEHDYCVIATGTSLTQDQVDAVQNAGLKIIAVSDAIRLVETPVALVSADRAWWMHHKACMHLSCLKVHNSAAWRDAPDDFINIDGAPAGLNSGLLGLMTSAYLGARRVILLGIDLHHAGDHFFGRHPEPLQSANADRIKIFQKQFEQWKKPVGMSIYNCAPASELKVYKRIPLEEALAKMSQPDDFISNTPVDNYL